MAMKAFNSGGEGPASIEVFAPTNEAGKPPPFFSGDVCLLFTQTIQVEF